MADWQHQRPRHTEFRLFPEGIQAGGHTSLHGVLHRHHGGVAVALGHGLDHCPDAGSRHQFRRDPLQGCQSLGCLFAVGTDGAEEGEAHEAGTGRPIGS